MTKKDDPWLGPIATVDNQERDKNVNVVKENKNKYKIPAYLYVIVGVAAIIFNSFFNEKEFFGTLISSIVSSGMVLAVVLIFVFLLKKIK
jgi:hypothetical protein